MSSRIKKIEDEIQNEKRLSKDKTSLVTHISHPISELADNKTIESERSLCDNNIEMNSTDSMKTTQNSIESDEEKDLAVSKTNSISSLLSSSKSIKLCLVH